MQWRPAVEVIIRYPTERVGFASHGEDLLV